MEMTEKNRPEKLWKGWTDEELDFIEKNYGKISTLEIANHLGRSISGIYRRALYLGLAKTKREYSSEDILFLRNNRNTMKIETIAKRLGRSKVSIRQKVRKLGIKKQKINK